MWIILLDRSSSMGEGFTEVPEVPARQRKISTEAASKWEAAKEAVLQQMASMQADEEIMLYIFNAHTAQVFSGTATETERVEQLLGEIHPENGTDLANALHNVYNDIRHLPYEHRALCIISDGLSKTAPARQAASEIATAVSMIEVMLINPTEEGREVAQAVAIRGRVTFVYQAQDLAVEIGKHQERAATDSFNLQMRLKEQELSANKITGQVPVEERLHITASWPGKIEELVWQPLYVFLHTGTAEQEVKKRIEEYAGKLHQVLANMRDSIKALRGTYFNVIPRVTGVHFNPQQQEIAWLEDLQEVPFRFITEDGNQEKKLSGTIDMEANGVLVATIPVAFLVQEDVEKETIPEIASGRIFSHVFASYSRKDTDILKACHETYKALGISLFIDREGLIPGEEWNPVLLKKIEEADSFQLYWSTHSSQSKNVAQEWQHALGLRTRKGSHFVRPLYWEKPRPATPKELNTLHFHLLDLSMFTKVAEQTGRAGAASPDTTNISNQQIGSEQLQHQALQLHPVVLPLLAGNTRQFIARLATHVARAVIFLEDITGCRYYPAPTLLADNFMVQESRTIQELTNMPPENIPDKKRAEALETWLSVLKSLLLDFHVGHIPPFKNRRNTDPVPAASHSFTTSQLQMLLMQAEAAVIQWIKDGAIFPWEDRFDNKIDPYGDIPLPADLLSEKISMVIARFLPYAPAHNYLSRQCIIEFDYPSYHSSSKFDERIGWEAIMPLLEAYSIQFSKSQPNRDEPRNWTYILTATEEEWIKVLSFSADSLTNELPAYNSRAYATANNIAGKELRCIGFALLMEKIAHKLNIRGYATDYFNRDNFSEWVIDWIYPAWQRSRDWHAAFMPGERVRDGVIDRPATEAFPGIDGNEDLAGFLAGYLSIMQNLFGLTKKDYGQDPWQGRYQISEQAVKKLQSNIKGLSLQFVKEYNDFLMQGTYNDYVELFRLTCQHVLDLARSIPDRLHRSPAYVQKIQAMVDFSLYGAYIPAGATAVDYQLQAWAMKNGVMQQSVLPSTSRVLFNTTKAPEHAILEQCVLVHEHFHAILETGLSPTGEKARGLQDIAAARRALPLNESLAVWMEWQFLEKHGHLAGSADEIQEAKEKIWEYINSGEYPAWPYKGAATLERIFQSKGITSIKAIISQLRAEPDQAMNAFEQLMNTQAGSGA